MHQFPYFLDATASDIATVVVRSVGRENSGPFLPNHCSRERFARLVVKPPAGSRVVRV